MAKRVAPSLSQAELEQLHKDTQRFGPVATFPWHEQQKVALRAATNKIVIVGGNRSGKSKVAEGIASRVVRREGPIYQRLRKPKGRPLRVWVAPQTDEKAKSLWEPRLLTMMEGLSGLRYVQTPHRHFVWEDDEGGGSLWLKSQEQGFLSFESDEVDLCVFDEEPEDKRVVSSAQTRFATTNGVMVLAYTPLNGMTWTYDSLYAPTVKDRYNIADRVWRKGNAVTVIGMGMADNPEAVAGGGVEAIMSDMSMAQAEKDARLYGTYGYTEGLLIPQLATLTNSSDSPYMVDVLPRERGYYWILTADPNKRHGALLTAIDHEGNRFYCAEHYAEDLPDSQHAAAYRAMLAEFHLRIEDVAVYSDPGGAGAQAIINLSELGFFATPVPKDPGSVSASINLLRRQAFMDPRHKHPITGQQPAPHMYFLRTLNSQWREGGVTYDESRLLYELRQYRQKPNAAPNTPVKKKDDLVDPARYVELVHMESPEAPWLDPALQARKKLDSLSQHEHNEWDKEMARLTKQFAAHTRHVA